MLQPNFEGLGVVVMDALLNRPWWEEEEFARLLRLPMRPVRQVLRLLETVNSPPSNSHLAGCGCMSLWERISLAKGSLAVTTDG